MPVAARQAAGIGRIKRRLLIANRDSKWTARREAAGGRDIGEIGRQAFDSFQLAAARTVETGHRAQQTHRVGMARLVKQLLGRSLLGDARGVHDDDAVGVARDHAEIMRDDDQRDVELARQVLHQLENLRLNRHVERGGRLVGDDQFRIAGESDGDHHALAHAAGELMRVLVEPAFRVGNADKGQQFDGARLRLLVVHAEMDLQRLLDLQPDGQDRVERGHRLLEDHRYVAAADFPHRFVVEIEQVAAVEHDAALRNFSGQARQQPHDRQRGDGLARARLADDGDHFAAVDREADAFDRADDAARGVKLGVQILDLQQRRSHLLLRGRLSAHVSIGINDGQAFIPLKSVARTPI